jgi:hypothetical protein
VPPRGSKRWSREGGTTQPTATASVGQVPEAGGQLLAPAGEVARTAHRHDGDGLVASAVDAQEPGGQVGGLALDLDPVGQRRIAGQLDLAAVLIRPEVRQMGPCPVHRNAEQGRDDCRRPFQSVGPVLSAMMSAQSGIPPRGTVTDGTDTGDRGQASLIADHPVDDRETRVGQPRDVRRATDRHDHHVGPHQPLPVGGADTELTDPVGRGHPGHRGAEDELRAVLAVPVQEHPAQVVPVEPGQRVRLVAHQRHRATEHECGRGQLGADQPGADDRHRDTRSQHR